MNKSDVLTYEKVMIPLRLPPEVYAQLMEVVHQRKKKERGYSINQYLTELLVQDLAKK